MFEKLFVLCEGFFGKVMRCVVMGSFVGVLMEWYDFFIFGMVVGLVFVLLFYLDSDFFIGFIVVFVIFGVGFLICFLGGIVFGYFGDKIG